MSRATQVFWDDLARDLEDPEFLRDYIVESIRIQAIDQVMAQIEEARDAIGISKADIARALNVKPAAIRRLLSTKNANPTLGTLAEVAAVLGYSVVLQPLDEDQQAEISIPLREGSSTDRLSTARRFAQVASVS